MAESVAPSAAAAESRQFRYRAIERSSGQVVTGERSASSAYELRAALRRGGLDLVAVDELGAPAAAGSGWWQYLRRTQSARRRRQRSLAVADLLDGLATMLRAGVTLEQAAGALASSRSRSPVERRLLRRVQEDLRAGRSPSEAICRDPDWFDDLDRAVLAAAERSGELASVLHDLATYRQRRGTIAQRLGTALLYPAILVVAGVGVWEFLSLKTLPPLIHLIQQAHRSPPALTMAVADLGRILAVWWPVAAVVIIVAIVQIRRRLDRVSPDSRLGYWWFANPLARLRIQARCADIAQALSRLLRAGTPLAEALDLVAGVAGDRRLGDLLQQGAAAVRRGEDLSAVVAASPLLDQEFAHMLQLGERGGELSDLLEAAAERYQRSAERAVDRATAILGPAAIVIIACLIGIIVMAAVLPLVQLGDLV